MDCTAAALGSRAPARRVPKTPPWRKAQADRPRPSTRGGWPAFVLARDWWSREPATASANAHQGWQFSCARPPRQVSMTAAQRPGLHQSSNVVDEPIERHAALPVVDRPMICRRVEHGAYGVFRSPRPRLFRHEDLEAGNGHVHEAAFRRGLNDRLELLLRDAHSFSVSLAETGVQARLAPSAASGCNGCGPCMAAAKRSGDRASLPAPCVGDACPARAGC